jgi:hypothetical protein
VKRLALLVFVAACKRTPTAEAPPSTPPSPPSPPAAAPLDATAAATAAVKEPVVADAAPRGALTARPDGIGPITEKTRVDLKALATAFPGYEVKKVSRSMGDGDLRETYIGVSKGSTLILKLVGDDFLEHVDVMSNDVQNPWGITIGMTGAELATHVGALDCEDAGEATDWRANLAACTGDKADRYEFDLHGDGIMGKEVAKDPAKRAAAKLVAIRWVVPGNTPPGAH